MIVTVETPDTTDVAALLAVHEALMRDQTPAESCHVRSADDLRAANGQVYTLRSETGALLAIAALVPLSATHEELKSMHTARAARGRGAGRALLDGMISDARSRGVTRISLETGSGPEHDAARALYAKAGFSETAPFADYPDDPLSTYMTRAF
ncbi:GNAT family N-acetyltransferase [Aquicoccus porphyridii]|uniref:GNAT family N-acetyltransferase n=1 Tax=Aquicoccus porphyridii TaxID=1852029 RepID=UPI00273FFEBD|nr:GNAT family N-acetyltransferase [Aquicoccus porphyridii]